jgi:hypothetical protein
VKLLDAILIGLGLACTALIIWAGATYRDHVYQLGYDAAVAAGEAVFEQATAAARRTESDLRAKLAARDADAFKKEKDHAASLEAAQRRVRAGIDSLRCPAAGPVPGAAAADDRPAAGGPEADGPGPAIVPEVAAEILSDGAAIAGLVRRYGRLEQRFDKCEALTKAP